MGAAAGGLSAAICSNCGATFYAEMFLEVWQPMYSTNYLFLASSAISLNQYLVTSLVITMPPIYLWAKRSTTIIVIWYLSGFGLHCLKNFCH